MMVRVKNLNGADRATTAHANMLLLRRWEKFSGRKVKVCAACHNEATIGAPVQRARGKNATWYIVPLCAACGRRSPAESFNVYEPLVPAVKCCVIREEKEKKNGKNGWRSWAGDHSKRKELETGTRRKIA